MSEPNEAGSGTEAGAQARPLLRVVNPDATPEEVAAIVAVFSALGSAGDREPRRRVSEWSAKHRRVRAHYSHGPGGWRSSGLPR